MNILFISNYYNHHQKFLSNALWERINKKYSFLETGEMSLERKKLGYGSIIKPEYVYQIDNQNFDMETEYFREADVVISGTASLELLKSLRDKGCLIFRCSERIYKDKFQRWKWPVRVIRINWNYGRHRKDYMLCASAYTAADYAKTFTYLNRNYKWGYFPETKKYQDIEGLVNTKKQNRILWCGRFLDWKHPDDVVMIAKRLKEDGFDFEIDFIGMGEKAQELQLMVEKYDLKDYIHFLGAMEPSRVRENMEKAGIYLFTSDRHEGWGAVLNESMNSGCAVVASHAIGSVPYLIQDNENGLVYESGNTEMLYEKVKYLLNHPDEQKRLGLEAYKTIINEWNAEVAAKRFVYLAECIKGGMKYPDLYQSGPCSRAEIIQDDWYLKRKGK